MATRKSGSRRPRQNKTIDLTANKPSETDVEANEAASVADELSGYDILKTGQDEPVTETAADYGDADADLYRSSSAHEPEDDLAADETIAAQERIFDTIQGTLPHIVISSVPLFRAGQEIPLDRC